MTPLGPRRTHLSGRRPDVRDLSVEESVDREIEAHIALLTEELIAAGWSPDEARAEAEQRLGDAETIRRDCRSVVRAGDRQRRLTGLAMDLQHDLRYAGRSLRRSPGFTLAAVLILSLGIGANSAVFSFFNNLLLELPPVSEPERLVRLFPRWEDGIQFGNLSPPEYHELAAQAAVFSELISETPIPLSVSFGGRNERLWGAVVTYNYFSGLGVIPHLGRGFSAPDDVEGSAAVAVLSHGFWRDRFGADPEILGRTLSINSRPFEIVGIAPPEYRDANAGFEPVLWAPFGQRYALMPGNSYLDARGQRWMAIAIARLAPGVRLEQAQAACDGVIAQLREEMPEVYRDQRFVLLSLVDSTLHPELRGTFSMGLGILWIVVGLTLLLACANVAGLLLARAAARQREIDIRFALGADRGRIVRQLLTESLVLALLAGALGLLGAGMLCRILRWIPVPADLPITFRGPLDSTVVLFTLGISFLTGLIFSLTPTLHTARRNLMTNLTNGFPVGRRGRLGVRRVLVAGQVALAVVLLIGAGLVVHSLYNLRQVDPGFEARNQLVAAVDLDLQGYERDEGRVFLNTLRERLLARPGIEAVGYGQVLPLYGLGGHRTGFRPEAIDLPPDFRNPAVEFNLVDSGYFSAFGIPIVRGRGFEQFEDEQPLRRVIINQSLARLFWPGADPIGESAWIGIGGSGFEVIGVARDVAYARPGESARPGMYLPRGLHYIGEVSLHVRTASDPAAYLSTVQNEIGDLDPTLPVYNLRVMTEQVRQALLPARLAAIALSAFALLALLLATIGIYGVIAYWVRQQTREIGVRLAIGATATEVLRFVLKRGLVTIGIGLGIGLILGLLMTQAMRSLLYGVGAVDLPALAAALLVLLTAALLACYLPARRAARLNPVAALRVE